MDKNDRSMIDKELVREFSNFINNNLSNIYSLTGIYVKDKESIEELIGLIETGELSTEDIFYSNFDLLVHDNYKDSIYLDDNMDYFSYENYFPEAKSVGSGSWIKIWSEDKTKYEIHWGKYFKPRDDYTTKFFKHSRKRLNCIKSIDLLDKWGDELTKLSILSRIPFGRYHVKYYTSKTKYKVVNPYQYEIVSNIQEYIDLLTEKVPNISIKTIVNSRVNKDKVFYLRSRGIPEYLAKIICDVTNIYFQVNFKKLVEMYNESLNFKLLKDVKS